ncbi:MAG: periplasmic heavy metal sensor [bacterium]
MRFFRRKRFTKPLLGLVVMLAAVVGLQGCFRSYGHDRHSPERMEQRMDDVQEHVSDFLEIRPEQQEGFQALMDGYRGLAKRWAADWRSSKDKMNDILQAETLDIDALGETLKGFLRKKPADAELEALIDRTIAFYRTLDAEQQEKLQKRLARHARRHS